MFCNKSDLAYIHLVNFQSASKFEKWYLPRMSIWANLGSTVREGNACSENKCDMTVNQILRNRILMEMNFGIIHHCLNLKSRILRIYLPGNDTPITDKGYKQEILEWAQRTRGFTCFRAQVLWLCVNSREGNLYEGFFLNNDVCHFLPLIEVFESSWSNMVFDPLHCYVLEN